MRSFWEATFISMIVVSVVFCFVLGLYYLRQNRVAHWESSAQQECEKIAKLSNASEHTVNSEYECVMVVEGKLKTIKDW